MVIQTPSINVRPRPFTSDPAHSCTIHFEMSAEDQCALLQENQSEIGAHRDSIEVAEGVAFTNSLTPEPSLGKSTRWSTKLGQVRSKFSQWNCNCHKKPRLRLVGVALVVTLAALIGLVIGLLIGRRIHHGDNSCSNTSSETTPTPSNTVPLHNWGSTVLIGGQSVDVAEVFASEIKTEEIRSYL